jgi:hypothetical protein
MCRLQAEGTFAVLLALGRQYRGEIQVPSLEVGGVGVGDIVRQHFGTLGAKPQCLLVNAQRFIETDAHVGTYAADQMVRAG